MLNAIQFASTPYEGSEISKNRTFTTQVLPRCFLHTSTWNVLRHKVVGGVKMNVSQSIVCGHVSIAVFDKSQGWEQINEVMIALVQVSNMCERGDWIKPYTSYKSAPMEKRTTSDASAVAAGDPEHHGPEMLSAVADDILRYGARFLVG